LNRLLQEPECYSVRQPVKFFVRAPLKVHPLYEQGYVMSCAVSFTGRKPCVSRSDFPTGV
jgi:hypothetical protein